MSARRDQFRPIDRLDLMPPWLERLMTPGMGVILTIIVYLFWKPG